MSICDLKLGEIGMIKSINGNEKLVKRLLALGCIEGTEVLLKNCAPLGDPIVINLRGFNLAIRKKDAQNISVNVPA
ncbi:ferrous iron transport protein A [Clostridium sp. AWRP]|uniref:FeoA family protein n=1 Tax=Clostridium sp. AWRP TaxID=2212991 RepID=UPI000FD89C08|nr:ferrous iron transport protein A [Clostridium sp. AWRP]AZV57114.1 ferrous iron transport protein A [Clostridium sp. AWRP]